MVVKRRQWQIIIIIRRRRDLLFLVRCVCVRARAFNYAKWNDDICTYLAEDEKLRQSSKSTQNNFKQKARKKHRATQRKKDHAEYSI